MTRRALLLAGKAGAESAPASRAAVGVAGHAAGPDVEVWTHTGRRAWFYQDLVRGRVVLINVFYTGCGDTCPLVTQNLLALQELLGDRVGRDLFMYSISLQPELETPEILRDYAALHGIGPGWELLTGAADDIDWLRWRLGFRNPDPDLDELDVVKDEHSGILRYGSEPLNRWAATPALLPPETIARAIRKSMFAA